VAAVVLAAALCAAAVAPAPRARAEPSARPIDADGIRACVERHSPGRSTVLSATIDVRDPSGPISRSAIKLYWLRMGDGERRVLLRVTDPPDLAGSAVLLEVPPDDGTPRVHLYLPELERLQRVRSREQLQVFLGEADLGIDEVGMLLDPVADGVLELIDAAGELDGRPVWVLVQPANDEASPYARRVSFIEQERCVLLRAEFQDDGNVARKVLEVAPAEFDRQGDVWIPRRLVFQDPRTRLVAEIRVDQVEVDVPIAPALLTVKALGSRAP
jgi:hypothetical protein